jgi:transglutaminase-like putative cysteine protease
MTRWRTFFLIDLLVLLAFTNHATMPPDERARLAASAAAPSAPAPRPPRPPPPVEQQPDPARALAKVAQGSAQQPGARLAAPAEVRALRHLLEDAGERELLEFAKVTKQLQAAGLEGQFRAQQAQALAQFQERLSAAERAAAALEVAADDAQRMKQITQLSKMLAAVPRRAQKIDLARLPFRAPQTQAREPRVDAAAFASKTLRAAALSKAATIAPAPQPPDLAETDDVQLTPEIRALAASLGGSPAQIFNWVHDNIRFLPTYGSVQGSALTLELRQGNAFDTASLLIALLRAANVPARYVQGTVDVPAAQVTNWVGGAPSVQAVQDLMGQGGIPNVALVAGGQLTHLRLEHVWVEAFVDFAPSRGALQKQGDSWVALDASFKQHALTAPIALSSLPVDYTALPAALAQLAQVDADGGVTGFYPGYIQESMTKLLSQTQAALEAQSPGYDQTLIIGGGKVLPSGMPVLPSALPYRLVARGTPASALTDAARHAVTLKLYATDLDRALDSPDAQVTVSLPALRGRRLSVNYAPSSPADAALIQSYVAAKASALPVYLIHLTPRVEIDGQVIAQGSSVTMGQDQFWDLSMQDPSGSAGGVDSYSVTAGDQIVFGIDGNGMTQQVAQDRLAAVSSDSSIHENLHHVSLRYWAQADAFDAATAGTRGVFAQRLPSAGLFSFPLSVRYQFGIARSASYSIYQMDLKRVLQAVAAPSDKVRIDYMSQSGLQGSYLESSAFEQLFSRLQGSGASTSQVLIDAAERGIPIYTIDASNQGVLAKVSLSAEAMADVNAAIAEGKRVIVPQRAPGAISGYILQDPTTGAAGYLIDGALSGGRGQKCQPEPEPVPQIVFQIGYALLLLMIMAAMVAAIAAIIGSGGTLAPGAVAAMVAMVAIGAALTPANAYAGQRSPCCTVLPVPHAGGDPIHDACADAIGPNDNPGMDAEVDGRNFDAVTGDATLWEVKTHNLANCTSKFCQSVLLPAWVSQARTQLAAYHVIAQKCGYLLSFGVGDPGFAALVGPPGGLYDALVVSPICLQP